LLFISFSDSAYEKSVDSSELGDRRGSVPVVCGHDVMETPSTPSRIVVSSSPLLNVGMCRNLNVNDAMAFII